VRSTRILLRSALALATASAGATPALAANTAYVRAEKHAAEGRLSLYTGHALAAGRSFESAYGALPNPEFLLEAGAAYARGKDFASAARVFGIASDLGLSGSRGQTARQGKEDALSSLRASRGRIALSVFPATATVTVDGEPLALDASGGVAWVAPGPHTVRAEAEGFEPAERAVEVALGEAKDVRVELQAVAGAPTLSLDANVAGATVLVDGRAVGTTPMSTLPLEEGAHEVRVEKPGYEPWARTVTIARGEPVALRADLVTQVVAQPATTSSAAAVEEDYEIEEGSSGADGLIIGGWVATGVGLAALGTGVAFHIMAASSQTEANNLSNVPPEGSGIDARTYYEQTYAPQYNALVADAENQQLLAVIMDAAGGAATATGIVLLVIGYTSDSGSDVSEVDDGPGLRLLGIGSAPVPGGAVINGGFSF
jgi:hypothetical protein